MTINICLPWSIVEEAVTFSDLDAMRLDLNRVQGVVEVPRETEAVVRLGVHSARQPHVLTLRHRHHLRFLTTTHWQVWQGKTDKHIDSTKPLHYIYILKKTKLEMR